MRSPTRPSFSSDFASPARCAATSRVTLAACKDGSSDFGSVQTAFSVSRWSPNSLRKNRLVCGVGNGRHTREPSKQEYRSKEWPMSQAMRNTGGFSSVWA
jgi:hypothetical protein